MRPEREHRFHNGWRVAATALLVAAGYYVGANLGLILRIPASTPSAIWPPNSILTATLLLAPKRRWWIYLLAALPAHLAAEWSTVSPHTLMFAFFATNCSEAVLAALCVRAFSDAPARLDTLRRVVVFLLGAAVVAPFLSSFLDAAAVHSLRLPGRGLPPLARGGAVLGCLAVAAILQPAQRAHCRHHHPHRRLRPQGGDGAAFTAQARRGRNPRHHAGVGGGPRVQRGPGTIRDSRR